MQNSKKIALIIGGIGLLLCIPCFFVKSDDYSSFWVGAAIVFTVILLIASFIYFLYSYFNDFKVHPSYRKEAKTMSIYLLGAFIISLLLSLIFGGMDPIMSGNGIEYSNKGQLLWYSSLIWTGLVLLIAAFVLSIKPVLTKKS